MKLVSFISTLSNPGNLISVGIQSSHGSILNLTAGALQIPDMQALIEKYTDSGFNSQLKDLALEIEKGNPSSTLDLIDAKFVRLVAPIPRPRRNVMCVGKNYREHVAEIAVKNAADAVSATKDAAKCATFFTKAPECVIGPEDTIPNHATITEHLDYEVELGVVIGKDGRDIHHSDAMGHIFGYTIGNDITARDLQRRHNQWFKGKSLDGTCPLGPCIVPLDSFDVDPNNLKLTLTVNGELRQSSHTSKMIFDVPEIIHQLSSGFTLRTGDIILTGTPEGVGYAMEPSGCLKAGDEVVAEIEGIGQLRNKVL
jgi:2-keto-4-pentenoate hydratase/2-oxohepta-3-ene-1,7-dioic acid hydratase in catechol pathway